MLAQGVQGIKNKSSGQVFVLLATLAEDKMKIINPEGKVLTVPGGLFHPPFWVSRTDLSNSFTSAQISAMNMMPERERKSAPKKLSSSSSSRLLRQPTSQTTVRRNAPPPTWFAASLTFYKHQIEPLSGGQYFIVEIENIGTFKITKDEFLRVFNDVVISKDYWQNGSFSYSSFPEKAQRFITPSI